MKNHKKIEGQLLQTNKKYSHLKNKQKEYISKELEKECRRYIQEKGLFPMNKYSHDVVEAVMEKIERKKIWIPYGEIYKHFMSKKTKICNRFLKEEFIVKKNGKYVLNRKVILYIAMSVDGYIADENGSVTWLDKYNDESTMDSFGEFFSSVDIVIMGRKSYDQVLTFGDYPYKDIKSYVYSNSKTGRDEHAEYVNKSPKELINELKEQIGKDIWLLGGADLIQSFVEDDLIDEYQIAVIPVILGKGIPLFKEINTTIDLSLAPKKSAKGFDMLCYRRSIQNEDE